MNRILFFLLSAFILFACNTKNTADGSKDHVQQTVENPPVLNDTLQNMKDKSDLKSEVQRNAILKKPLIKKNNINSPSGNKTLKISTLDLRPADQLNVIKLIDSLVAENESLLHGITKEKQIEASIIKFNNYITNVLKFQVINWQGTVQRITVLEHAAIEVEIYFQFDVKSSGSNPKSGSIVFPSMVSTSDISVTDQLADLVEGDTIIFSGTIPAFINNALAMRTYTTLTENFITHPQVFLQLEVIEKVVN